MIGYFFVVKDLCHLNKMPKDSQEFEGCIGKRAVQNMGLRKSANNVHEIHNNSHQKLFRGQQELSRSTKVQNV